MADPVTAINAATDTVNAAHSLLTAIIAFVPTAGYAITAMAAFVPKPTAESPIAIRYAYKAMTYIAFNIKHATNVADDRRRKQNHDQNQNQNLDTESNS